MMEIPNWIVIANYESFWQEPEEEENEEEEDTWHESYDWNLS